MNLRGRRLAAHAAWQIMRVPHVGFTEAGAAHEYLADGNPFGKGVIRVS